MVAGLHPTTAGCTRRGSGATSTGQSPASSQGVQRAASSRARRASGPRGRRHGEGAAKWLKDVAGTGSSALDAAAAPPECHPILREEQVRFGLEAVSVTHRCKREPHSIMLFECDFKPVVRQAADRRESGLPFHQAPDGAVEALPRAPPAGNPLRSAAEAPDSPRSSSLRAAILAGAGA